MYRVGILTASDKGAAGARTDESGPLIESLLPEGYEVVCRSILPDERAPLAAELRRLCDEEGCDLVLTTGGTGFSLRDVTPEATRDVAERDVPGIAEAIRAASLAVTPRAMVGRGSSVRRGRTLIISLPGSRKAVRESMAVFIDVIGHGLDVLRGTAGDCAVK